MKARGNWQGMITVFRFNWPLYLIAGLVFAAASFALFLPLPVLAKLGCGAAIAGSGYFLFVSLGVSHLVYDRSDLYRWRWLERALKDTARERIVVCHSGFDEVSEALRHRICPVESVVLDHFDAERMTEPSINKARRLFPPTPETIASPYDQWPEADGSTDLIFGLLAIHEFRGEKERASWFAEARRCLKPHGRIIIAEHLRDPANFLAFGPGFLHFHSSASWERCWTTAGLRKADDFSMTPWVRIFVLTPP